MAILPSVYIVYAVTVMFSVTPVSCSLPNCLRTPMNTTSICSYLDINSTAPWCKAGSFTNTTFTFYIKPKESFRELRVKMIRVVSRGLYGDLSQESRPNATSSSWILGEESDYVGFVLEATFIGEMWHEVRVQPTDEDQARPREYSIYVDGTLRDTKTLSFSNPSIFTIRTHGSLSYSEHCNPGDLGLQKPLLQLGAISASSRDTSSRKDWLGAATAVIGSLIFVAFIAVALVLNKKCQSPNRLFDEDIDRAAEGGGQENTLRF